MQLGYEDADIDIAIMDGMVLCWFTEALSKWPNTVTEHGQNNNI